MTMVIDGTNGATFPNSSVQTVAALAAPQSMVRLNTANGYGTTNTSVRRFTNTVTSQGTDITYTDSATLGATFTVNNAGVYAIAYSDNFTAAQTVVLSLNSTVTTGSTGTIPIALVLSAMTTPTSGYAAFCSWTGYLPLNSVIRAQTDGGAAGASPIAMQFTIVRVA